MRRLSINIDHIATLRQARKSAYPDPVVAAGICELSGADGITFHLREDRRHIQDRDVRLLKEIVTTKLNFEMAATEEMAKIALETKPFLITLVPEKRQELTTEGGLNVKENIDQLKDYCQQFKKEGIGVCLFVDPSLNQIEACKKVECDYIEIHTGIYCETKTIKDQDIELDRIVKACQLANSLKLKVNAGHGIHYHNIKPLAQIKEIEEFSIGHSIISRAVFVGLERAVKEMKDLINYF